jgi:hypothetical protein
MPAVRIILLCVAAALGVLAAAAAPVSSWSDCSPVTTRSQRSLCSASLL